MNKKSCLKRTMTLIMVLILGIGLIACTSTEENASNDTDSSSTESSSTDTKEAAEEASENEAQSSEETSDDNETQASTDTDESGTRTVSTIMGDIEVPNDPQRVVVNWEIGYAYSLGLNVVGYYGWAHETMPFYDQMLESTEIVNWEPEEVMALEPDLIITYKQEDYDKFSKVAPVLVISLDENEPEEVLTLMGQATGHEEEAQEQIDAFEDELLAAKDVFEQEKFEGKTFSVNQDWGSASYGVYYETASRGGTLIYDYLDLPMPDSLIQLIEDSGNTRGGLSYEVASQYFGDYILWFRSYTEAEDQPSEYELSELWETVPAVANDQVIIIPGVETGLFYYDDVLSLRNQLEYIVDRFEEL